MQTGHRNQLKPRLADAAPASTVGLTDTKAYTPRWNPHRIRDVWPRNERQRRLAWSATATPCATAFGSGHNLGATQHIHVSEGRQSDALSKKFHNQFIVRNVAPIM